MSVSLRRLRRVLTLRRCARLTLVLAAIAAFSSTLGAAPPSVHPITDATNATPIVITSAGHDLFTGAQVLIAGVSGNTAANGGWTLTVVDADRFSLNGSAGSGLYTSGGTYAESQGALTSLVVTTTADTDDGVCDADCSLREALAVAEADTGAETITFAIPTTDPGYDAATGAHTITLTSPLSVLGGKVTVTGPGVARLAISGNDAVRIFNLANADVTLSHLTIRDAFDDGLMGSFGAAIESDQSILNVVNCQFLENFGDFKSNGGIRAVDGVLNVSNTLFFANAGIKDGGAIQLMGGAVANVANSTFSNNSGNRGGALFVLDGATMNLSSSTLYSNNSGGGKWGIYVGGTITMRNSIVTNGSPLCNDAGGTLTGTNNLLDDDSCGNDPAFSVGAVTNFDTTLQNNGGPTATHALLADSNAIDAVPAGQCTFLSSGINPLFANGAAITTDQRGVARPQGAACDIGAFERVPNRPPTPLNDTYPVVLDTPLTVAAPGVLANDTDPDGNALQAFPVGGPSHGTLQLSPNGAFTYTPDSGYLGPDAFTYQAGDGEASTNATATITVAAPTCGIDVQPVTIATPFLGLAYSQLLSATPSQLYTFTVTTGALPPGLTLSPTAQGATLKGVPTTAGTYTFTITAQQKNSSCRNTRTYTVTTPGTVVPVLTCMVKLGAHTYRGTFGYINTTGASVAIPVGANNGFAPAPQNRSQGTTFAPGTVSNAFNVTFPPDRSEDGGNAIGVWTLRGPDNQKRTVTLTETTVRCQ